MVGTLNLDCHKDINNNRHLNLRKVFQDMLSSVFVDDKNCPILLLYCTVSIFFRYISSWKITRGNSSKMKKHGYQLVEAKEGNFGEEGRIDEKHFLSIYTYDVMMSYLYHFYRVSGTTMTKSFSKNLSKFVFGMKYTEEKDRHESGEKEN